MYRQLHRTALSVVFMCSLVTVSEAVMYTYQGPNYAILDGTRFTASDSLSGDHVDQHSTVWRDLYWFRVVGRPM